MIDCFVIVKLCRDLFVVKMRLVWQGWSRGFVDVKGDKFILYLDKIRLFFDRNQV